MRGVLGVLLCFFSGFLSVAAICPTGWASHGYSCYNIFYDQRTRSDAINECNTWSASLVTIYDQAEQAFLIKLISGSQDPSASFWVELVQFNNTWAWQGEEVVPAQPWLIWTPSNISYNQFAAIFLVANKLYVTPVSNSSSEKMMYVCERDIEARDLCDRPNGWQSIWNYAACYKVYNPTTWADAAATCNKYSGKLLSFEGGFIPDSLVDIAIGSNGSVWADLTDTDSVGNFHTSSGDTVINLRWINGAQKDVVNPTKTCGLVTRDVTNSSNTGYVLEDCEEEHPFVCMKPVAPCKLGWLQYGMDCLQPHLRPEEKVTWYDATAACAAVGATLTQDLPVQPYAMLHQVLQDEDVDLVWTGFNGPPFSYWSSDVVTKTVTMFPTTNVVGAPTTCGVTDYADRDSELADYCFTPRGYVCHTQVSTPSVNIEAKTSVCNPGFFPHKDTCYKIIWNKMTFAKAVDQCKNVGGDILTVTSPDQQGFFNDRVFMDRSISDFWIGVLYNSTTKEYSLSTTNAKATFMNFDARKNPTNPDSSCAVVEAGKLVDFNGAWVLKYCNDVSNVICQHTPTSSLPVPAPPDVIWTKECGNWDFASPNNCYFLSGLEKKNWREARRTCQDMGGDLASIGDLTEQYAVIAMLVSSRYQHVQTPLWIGLSDMQEGFGWGWSDGRPLSYLYWAGDQPRYYSDDGDNCGYIPISKEFKWEARECDHELGFLCKKPIKIDNTIPTTPAPKQCDGSGLISDEHALLFPQSFTASSYLDEKHRPEYCRFTPFNQAAWSPATNSSDEWLAVTFHETMNIYGINIGGEPQNDNYVLKFRAQYKMDLDSKWEWITDEKGQIQDFDGPTMKGETSANYVEIHAQAIRIFPLEYSWWPALQLEVEGCLQDPCKPVSGLRGPFPLTRSQITASSNGQPNQLHLTKWNFGDDEVKTDGYKWIQIDFGTLRIFSSLVFKKSYNAFKRVSEMWLQFSRDDPSDPNFQLTNYTVPYGDNHVFDLRFNGNVILPYTVEARVIRIHVNTTKETPLDFDVFICPTGCRAEPILVNLPSTSFNASDHSVNYGPERSTYNNLGWKPRNPSDTTGYIQVDLETPMQIIAVETKEAYNAYVSSYYLAFSRDDPNNMQWYSAQGDGSLTSDINKRMEFSGKLDLDTFNRIPMRRNELPSPVNARYVRLYPKTYKGSVGLKWEIYACAKHLATDPVGCFADDPNDKDLPYAVTGGKYEGIYPQACVTHCYENGFHFAALESGDVCSCGNTYGAYGQSLNACNSSCLPPYANFSCGGVDSELIYSTGLGPKMMVCPAGWISFRDSCYFLMIDQQTWPVARDSCKRLNGHLVDIADDDENRFVSALVASSGVDQGWIGLTDIKVPMTFEWVSEREVLYTHWARHKPNSNPGLEQHTVAISADGGWINIFDEKQLQYVCETAQIPAENRTTYDVDEECGKGWVRLGQYCYYLQRQKETWDGASKLCNALSATLVAPDSSLRNSEMTFLLANVRGEYWVDVKQVNGQFVHAAQKSSLVQYPMWDQLQPGSNGSCVSLKSFIHAGNWVLRPCDLKLSSLCQKPAISPNLFSSTTPVPTTPSTKQCPNGWLENGNFCYKYTSPAGQQKLNWHQASQNCKDLNSQLASFHNKDELSDVYAKIKNGQEEKSNFWIGLNALDTQQGFLWTDGSPVNFIQWNDGQPNRTTPDVNCVEVGKDTGSMALTECTHARAWLCKITKGTTVTDPQFIPYPTADPNLGACSQLSGSWFRFKGNCYHFESGNGGTIDAKTWREAEAFCEQFHSTLASIDTPEENRFIQGMLKLETRTRSAWIGLNELGGQKNYKWADLTPVGNFTNWDVNEPNDFGGTEACVEIVLGNGKWANNHCAQRQGFICKTPSPDTTSKPPPPPPTLTGNCPDRFHQFGTRCFRVFGTPGAELFTYDQALKACRSFEASTAFIYYDLASIQSKAENAFVTTLLNENRISAWIGLQRYPTKEWFWTDSKDLLYVNWNTQEPNMPKDQHGCTYMYAPAWAAGMWNDVNCDQKAAYVCACDINPNLPINIQPPPAQCPNGYSLFGKSCYTVYKEKKTQSEAHDVCLQDNAHLATVMDLYDWSDLYLRARVFPNGMWIGLKQKKDGVFEWESGYPVTFTRWAKQQPQKRYEWGCVSMNQEGLFENGRCDDVRQFACRKDIEKPQIKPIPTGGSCSEPGFVLDGTACYLYVNKSSTYDDAAEACLQMGAKLASVPNKLNTQYNKTVWIGLRQSYDEGFQWEDGSPLARLFWASGQPSFPGNNAAETGCVSMTANGLWVNDYCQNQYPFVCMMDRFFDGGPPTMGTTAIATPNVRTNKPTPVTRRPTDGAQTPVIIPSRMTNPPNKGTGTGLTTIKTTANGLADNQTDKNGMTGGETAATVIGVIAVVAVVAVGGFIFLKRRGVFNRGSFLRKEASKYKNFENSLYEETHKDAQSKSAVNIIPMDRADNRGYSVSYSATPEITVTENVTTSDEGPVIPFTEDDDCW